MNEEVIKNQRKQIEIESQVNLWTLKRTQTIYGGNNFVVRIVWISCSEIQLNDKHESTAKALTRRHTHIESIHLNVEHDDRVVAATTRR